MLFLVSTLLAAALHQCQPWSSTELAAEEAQVPLQVIFCHCRCPQRVLALQQLPQAGDSPSGFTDPRLATLSVCPQTLCGAMLGRFLQAAASRPTSSQEFLG